MPVLPVPSLYHLLKWIRFFFLYLQSYKDPSFTVKKKDCESNGNCQI